MTSPTLEDVAMVVEARAGRSLTRAEAGGLERAWGERGRSIVARVALATLVVATDWPATLRTAALEVYGLEGLDRTGAPG